MRTSDRILLILIAIVSIAVAVLLILSHFVGITIGYENVLSFSLNDAVMEDVCIAIAALIALTVGTSLFVIVSRSYKYRLIHRQDIVQITADEKGNAEITFDALRALAVRRCKTFRWVSDCSCDVDVIKNGIVLFVKLRPVNDTVLTNASEQLREELHRSIWEQTGIRLAQVRVLILPYKAIHK